MTEELKHDEELKQQAKQVDVSIPLDYETKLEENVDNYRQWYDEHMALMNSSEHKNVEEHRDAVRKHFKERYGGMLGKDLGERMDPDYLLSMWQRFMEKEYQDFLKAHTNLSIEKILGVGIDHFAYILGWEDTDDVTKWRNNKVRVGICVNCQETMVANIIQYNHGLCANCKPQFSERAMRHFMLHQLDHAPRYQGGAEHDLKMDFYIMFMHDERFRKLFLKGTESAAELEAMQYSADQETKTNG